MMLAAYLIGGEIEASKQGTNATLWEQWAKEEHLVVTDLALSDAQLPLLPLATAATWTARASQGQCSGILRIHGQPANWSIKKVRGTATLVIDTGNAEQEPARRNDV